MKPRIGHQGSEEDELIEEVAVSSRKIRGLVRARRKAASAHYGMVEGVHKPGINHW